jgi:hypothetical protein
VITHRQDRHDRHDHIEQDEFEQRSRQMSVQTTFTTVSAGSGGASSGMPSGGLIRGDVATVGRLQQAARQADALAEQVQILLGMVHAAAGSLPDRLAQADWGTDAVTSAADAVGDAVSVEALNAEALTGLLEQLGVLDAAVAAAEQLGAEVLSRGADGRAEAFADA